MPNAPVPAAATGLPKSTARRGPTMDELAAMLDLFQRADAATKEAALKFLEEAAAKRRAAATS